MINGLLYVLTHFWLTGILMLAVVLVDGGCNLAHPTDDRNPTVRLVGMILALVFELVKSICHPRLQ